SSNSQLSCHLKRLMVLEPYVVRRNPERLKYWPNLRWVAAQFCPAGCHVQKNENALTGRKSIRPPVLLAAAGPARVSLNVMRLAEHGSQFWACRLVAHQRPNREVHWHGDRLHFRTTLYDELAANAKDQLPGRLQGT